MLSISSHDRLTLGWTLHRVLEMLIKVLDTCAVNFGELCIESIIVCFASSQLLRTRQADDRQGTLSKTSPRRESLICVDQHSQHIHAISLE